VLPSAIRGEESRLFSVREETLKPAEPIRQSPLHDAHVTAGGRLVDFAGWRLPIQYRGVIEEHNAVRTKVGLFDVSHMGEVSVRGAQALDFLQHVTCNNVARLAPGRAHYSGLMTPEGCFVDDLLVYQLDEEDYLLVINAANTAKDVAWLVRHASEFDVRVSDDSARWCQLALQGPLAETVLASLTDLDLAAIRYYGFERTALQGADSIVSRTGYTGEDGFEIYGPAEAGMRLWSALLEAGAPHGIAPIGLGARDTLRLEAKMTLYGNDIDDSTTPYEADLAWIVKLKKGDFVGRDVLARQKQDGLTRKLVGFEMRGRAIARHGFKAVLDGRPVGEVTSGSFAPYLKKSIGLTYLPIDLTEVGTEFEIEIRGRTEPAEVVTTPFYKRD
jgi:aminomethyltransferase